MITKKKLFGYFLFILVVVILPPALDYGASYYIKRTKYAPLIFTKYDSEDTARKVYKRYTEDVLTWEIGFFGEDKNTGYYGTIIYDAKRLFTGYKYLKDNKETNRQKFWGYFDYFSLKTLFGYYDRCYLVIYFDNYHFNTSKSQCVLHNIFKDGFEENQHVF